MQVIRIIGWVIVAVVMTAFVAMNWETAPVRFWPLGNGDFLRFDWPVGFTALFFFLLGLVPTWLLAKAAKWRQARRIAALETSIRAGTVPPLATTTQLDAANPDNPQP